MVTRSLLAFRTRGGPGTYGGQQPWPTPDAPRTQRGDVAVVDTLEGALGQAALVLAGLAVVLLAVILVLVEADFILGRLDKLARRWEATRRDPPDPDPPAPDQGDTERPRDGQGAQ